MRFGSSGRTRTYNPSVNSRTACSRLTLQTRDLDAPKCEFRVELGGLWGDSREWQLKESPGPLQHRTTAQCHWIRDAGRHAGRPAERDPRRTRSQVGGGAASAATAPSTGRMRFGVTMALPGETEAGTAGTQPCRGIAWWAHRDDAGGRGSRLSRSSQNHIGSVDPDALKIPARRAECSLTENARSPFHAEPEQERQTKGVAEGAQTPFFHAVRNLR